MVDFFSVFMKNTINWKTFFILLGLSLFSVICVFPYVMTLQGDLLGKIGQPIEVIFIAQFIQSIILFSLTILGGLILAQKIDFRIPISKGFWSKSVLLGAATAVIIYLLDSLFTFLGTTITTHQDSAPVWQKLLAAFYGGITEEILLRLFLMTLFIWIGMKLFRHKKPTSTGIITSILLAAVIFGLGHLPITASLTQIDALVVTRAVVLNGVGGIVFGWLFWKKGLVSAMITHFTADVFLLTLLPLLFK